MNKLKVRSFALHSLNGVFDDVVIEGVRDLHIAGLKELTIRLIAKPDKRAKNDPQKRIDEAIKDLKRAGISLDNYIGGTRIHQDGTVESTGRFTAHFSVLNSALNAKFKVGDFVTDSYGMRLFEVTGIRSGGVYDVVDYENGTATYTMPEAKMRKASASLVKSYNNSTASTNPVVRNALAWRAGNSSFDGKSVKTGRIHKDSPMRGFYQFISDDGIMALDASDDPREARRIAEKAGFKVHS